MGWTYFQKPENIKEWFTKELTWDTETATNRCLKVAQVHLVEMYGAVETVNKATGERRVWAAVFMLDFLRKPAFNFGYKDMDESMGPVICNCPESILNLLTSPVGMLLRDGVPSMLAHTCREQGEETKRKFIFIDSL